LPVEAIEDRIEKLFTVLYDILEGNASVFDVRLGEMCRDSRNVAYLLREENPAGNKDGTER
jgi:hypothetical protein